MWEAKEDGGRNKMNEMHVICNLTVKIGGSALLFFTSNIGEEFLLKEKKSYFLIYTSLPFEIRDINTWIKMQI